MLQCLGWCRLLTPENVTLSKANVGDLQLKDKKGHGLNHLEFVFFTTQKRSSGGGFPRRDPGESSDGGVSTERHFDWFSFQKSFWPSKRLCTCGRFKTWKPQFFRHDDYIDAYRILRPLRWFSCCLGMRVAHLD